MKSSDAKASEASRAVSTSTFSGCGATRGRACGRFPAGAGRFAGRGFGAGLFLPFKNALPAVVTSREYLALSGSGTPPA